MNFTTVKNQIEFRSYLNYHVVSHLPNQRNDNQIVKSKQQLDNHSGRLRHFLNGFASLGKMLERGYNTRSALECVVLSASIVDGFLRIALILKEQIETKSDYIDPSLLHQKKEDRPISERTIFNRCLEKQIITKKLFERISKAYDSRNRCIHRYLISDINYRYVTNLVFEYAKLIDKIRDSVFALEEEQIAKKVGMTKDSDDLVSSINLMASEKEKRPSFDG